MKFNERELAVWASALIPDKEGLLEKRGAGISHGYRLRWFRLKGNLLFYFKVDDNGDWQSYGDPVGVIVLERVSVDKYPSDSKPYSFVLNFEGDDSRAYFLTAYSESEMVSWMRAIQTASYEGLKGMLYKLQTKLTTLTGEDPLKDKNVSFIGPQVSPHKITRQLFDAKRSLYQRSSNSVRARKLINTTSSTTQHPQYELNLSCSSLPLNKEGMPPATVVRVRSYANSEYRHALATIGQTEIVESSVSPNFARIIILDISPLCPLSAHLKFEVFSVNSKITDQLTDSCRLTLPRDASSSIVLEDGCGSDDTIEVRKGVCIGRAECQVSAIHSSSYTKEMKLPLSLDHLVCGFLQIVAQKFDNDGRRNALNPVDRYALVGYLPSIMTNSVRCHFSFPATINGKKVKLKVIEEMTESIFNLQVPIELLKCLIKEDADMLEELNAIGALEDKQKSLLLYYQEMLVESISSYKATIAALENLGDTCGFKPSTQKRDRELQMLLCNLHIQKMRVRELLNKDIVGETSYFVVTSGCPADHVSGFKYGGLKRMLSECRSCPSFIAASSTGRSSLNHFRARLRQIKASIYFHNATLYRACANASPPNMNSAMIGISKEIQQLLVLMDNITVKDAIDALINARPGQPSPKLQHKDEPLLTKSLDTSLNKENVQLDVKRKSIHLPVTKCSCGKCSRCVPSPSDWAWNGSKFVQVSKDWKMSDSSDNIQSALCELIEKVEAATSKVVDQQHLAVAQEVGLKIGTFKPTYVWSLDLIPIFAHLNQTLEGLFKVASSSLSFAALIHDSYVHNFKLLKRRRDIVFSQVLTALVTSFYTVLSKYFTDSTFIDQIREIGFLVDFESLLSSLGDEIGMLEDMCIAVQELTTVQFQLAELRGEDGMSFDFRISGTRDCLIVQFLIARDVFVLLSDEKLRQGKKIKVIPILFTQGINEKQTLANLKHDLLLQSSLKLQDEVNSQSMKALSEYVDSFEKLLLEKGNSSSKLLAVQIRDLHNLLQHSYSSQKSKNVEFLLTIEQLVHCLHGGRLTSCKSGKDRTGMAVTLEECCFLRNYHHLDSSAFNKTLSIIRSHGTRLENCLKNTGHRCYHFNQLQLMLLPKLLTPPPFTCRDPE